MPRSLPWMRRTTLGVLCGLAGCAPTTVTVSFATDGDMLSTVSAQIAVGTAAPDAPHPLSVNGLTSGSFLVPLADDEVEPVVVTLAGTTSNGEPVGATGSVTSVAHRDAKLTLALTCGVYCDNFDDRENPDVQGRWSPYMPFGPSTTAPTLSSAESVSAPHSALFHAQAFDDPTGMLEQGVQMGVTFPLIGSSFVLDFDVMVSGYATGGSGFIGLAEVRAGSQLTAGLTLKNAQLVALQYLLNNMLQGQTDHADYAPSQPISQGVWHHVHYAEHFDTQAGSLDITWDDAVVYDATNIPTWAGSQPTPTSATFLISAVAHGVTPEADVYFDNVRIQ